MEAVLHDSNELSVTQLSISILIEKSKHSMDNMFAEAGACADLHSSVELIWKQIQLYSGYYEICLSFAVVGKILPTISSSYNLIQLRMW